MKLFVWRLPLIVIVALAASAVALMWLHESLVSDRHPPLPATDTVLHLRFGHNFYPDSALHMAAEKFAEIVKRETKGRVDVTVFPAQKLGTDDQMIEMARDGTLDILLVPTAKLGTAVPALHYADLPFFFRDREETYRMLDGEPGRMALDKLSAIDLVGVTFWENGFKQFTANRPIREPEDLKGLKMRVMKSRIIMDQFQAFGAIPLPIDFYSTFQALKDGAVDGQENPLSAIIAMDFHKVQHHLTLSNHGYLGYALVISGKVFQTLPNAIASLLIEVARGLTPFEREEARRREAGFLEAIRAAGVTVHELTDEQRRHFSALTAHIPHQFEEMIGSDIVSRSEELMREQRLGAAAERDIVIGLDTDLSAGAAHAGLAIKRGALLAIGEINEQGGVLGRKLALIARDDHALPERGARNIQDLATKPNLVAVLGGSSSNVVLGEIEAVHRAKVPFLNPWAAAAGVIDNGHVPNFVFRLSVTDQDSGSFLVKQALAAHQRPGLLLINTLWGRENLASLTAILERHGITPTTVEWINGGERNISVHLSRIEASGADVIVMVASAAESVSIINAMATRPRPLPIVSHWGASIGSSRDDIPAALGKVDLTFIQTFSFLTSGTPKTRDVVQRYKATFDVSSAAEIFVPVATAQAYDLVHLLALAITAAGTTDRAAVRDALEGIDSYAGLIKTYHQPFTPSRHDALSVDDYSLNRYDSNGVIVPAPPFVNAPP